MHNRQEDPEQDDQYQRWLDSQETQHRARSAAALEALIPLLALLSAPTREVAEAAGIPQPAELQDARTFPLPRWAAPPTTKARRLRYCEMCDTWTRRRECRACGADTQRWM
ncbi:MAG: hypothetical protein ABWY78_06155 [Microvirga sp.]